MTTQLLRFPEVKLRTGLSRSSIYLRIKEGTFPAPVKLGDRAVAWVASDVDAFIEKTVQASRGA